MTPDQERLPAALLELIASFCDQERKSSVLHWMRSPSECMTPEALSVNKTSRVSLASCLLRRISELGINIVRTAFVCAPDGGASARYAIQIGSCRMTYVVRSFSWDGREKVGRRADGVTRDMFSALFLGEPDEARISREIAIFDEKDAPNPMFDPVFGLADVDRLRTDANVIGWIPANRSVASFESMVETLVAGEQPDRSEIFRNSGYILRNAGFLGSGRNGALSFQGFPEDHPLHHPYFAECFGLYLIRMFSIDLVNGTAAARNPAAATLAPEVARLIGVGNSSGQGMCVAIQRWPHWIATWVVVREVAIAYSKSCSFLQDDSSFAAIRARLTDEATRHQAIRLQSEEFVTSPRIIARELDAFRCAAEDAARSHSCEISCWGDAVTRLTSGFSPETIEQIHSILIDANPDFADAVCGYYVQGMVRARDYDPALSVGRFRDLLRSGYSWALKQDLTNSKTRRTFWYHSAEGGEQRRGNRGEDPHEEFESFIDLVGTIQRLAAVLSSYPDDTPSAQVVADNPDLYFVMSRVCYLAEVPYAEVRGNLSHEDFAPSLLIRFFLSVLGMEFSSPLSSRYVRGVFLQGAPLREDFSSLSGDQPDRAGRS